MGKTSKIEWCDATYNPWRGCIKVSPGCKFCYMYREQERYGRDPREVIRAAPGTFRAPLAWKEPLKVFTCSWSDFFIEQADPWRAEAWEIIRRTPQHTYLILTKRPENVRERLPLAWALDQDAGWKTWGHVWLGVSVESQKYLHRATTLSQIRAPHRFISYEPALEPVDFLPVLDGSYEWLISGGESGYQPRPADLWWFEDAMAQCTARGVSYFHKQHGGKTKIGNSWGGHVLPSGVYHEFPDSMQR